MADSDIFLNKINSILQKYTSKGETGVKITLDVLTSLFGTKNKELLAKYVEPLNKYLPIYGINTKQDIAAFLGQVGHESAGFTKITEDLHYSSERMIEVFPRLFKSSDPVKDKQLKLKAMAIAKKPEQFANYVYANKIGNGPEASGDGWQYRGAGLIQLTGFSNHNQFAQSKKMDIKKVGDYARTPEGAVETACFFWKVNGLSAFANKGDLEGLTRKVNTAGLGLSERVEIAHKAIKLLK